MCWGTGSPSRTLPLPGAVAGGCASTREGPGAGVRPPGRAKRLIEVRTEHERKEHDTVHLSKAGALKAHQCAGFVHPFTCDSVCSMTGSQVPGLGYNNHAQRYADTFQDESLPMFPLDRNMIRLLVDLVGGHPRVLDAGCGVGQVTKMLRNWGCDAVGVDAANKLIELARAAYPGIAFTVGDIRALPYPEEDFDAVVARYSVIHTDPAQVPVVVGEFARVLRPGGSLLVEFQSSGGATHPFAHAAGPAWAWNPDGMASLLSSAGLVERARLVCPAQPSIKYAGTSEAHLLFRKPGPPCGPEPLVD